jgi:hypothetical protein
VFLGAWRLSEQSAIRNRLLNDQLEYYEAPTRRALQAVFKEGESGVTVHLTGEDLHGFKNRCYVPNDTIRMFKAILPQAEELHPDSIFASGTRNVKVGIVDEHFEIPLYEGRHDSRKCSDAHVNVSGLTFTQWQKSFLRLIAYYLNESSAMKPVGHFGIHTQHDYEKATKIKHFEIGDNCIDIGRYGPLRKQDRKVRFIGLEHWNPFSPFSPKPVPNNRQPEDLFLLKTFIFSQLPSEYSFSVTEQLHGQIQTIDISSDIDGELHGIAKSEVTTYGLYQSCEQ